jgi:hypothetical protein
LFIIGKLTNYTNSKTIFYSKSTVKKINASTIFSGRSLPAGRSCCSLQVLATPKSVTAGFSLPSLTQIELRPDIGITIWDFLIYA